MALPEGTHCGLYSKGKMLNLNTEYLLINILDQKCHLDDKYTEEQIRKATGVLMTNGTSLQLPHGSHGVGIGLYPVYAMGNHSCM